MISARKRKEPLPVWEEALSALGEKTLFVLFHGYTGVARLLLSLGLFNRHSLVYPFIGGFQVGCAGFGVVGVEFTRLAIILLGILKFFHLQIKVSDPFDAIDILGITLQHCFVLVNGLLGHAIVILGIGAGDVLLGVGSRQIEASINQAGVE